jgi:glycosyltransferase involved in cell wall biosynthesis
MKITILTSGSIRSNFVYRALAFARALHKQGHDVSLIAPQADKYNDFRAEKINIIDGVKILQPFQFKTKRPEINLLPYLFNAMRMALQQKSDLIYIYKPTPINIVGFIVKFFRKTPVIVDLDDLGSEVMKIEGHPWHQWKLVEWSEKFAVKHADRLVVASSYLFEKYHKEFPDTPIHSMPNGVESDWFASPIFSKEKKRIVFMGSINRRTILEPFFEVLPEIIKQHPDTKVLMIGAGKDLEYFKEKARAAGISAKVTFTGWLNIEDARLQLHAGDIGYNYMPDEPTVKAASNMKVPQYMARGVVPMVSDIGDLPASVDFGKAGYVAKANDAEALKNALQIALEDKDRLQKSEQARAFAAKKFDWDILAGDFYQWLTSKTIVQKKNKKQKVYVVATTVPGDFGGGEIRNYNLIKQLIKQTDVEVEVFCISPNDPENARKNFESKINAVCHAVPAHPRSMDVVMRAFFLEQVPPFFEIFKSSGVGDVFRAACERSLPDIVQIEQLQAYYCIRPHILWLKSRGVKIVLDCHNVEFQSFDDSLEIFSLSKKLTGKLLVSHFKKLEIEATQRADLIFACSKVDADFFKQYNPKTYIIPNGVDCSEFQLFQKDQNSTPNLIFMGSVGYPPNGDAMQFYLDAIHPMVKEQISSIQLLAIGADKDWLDSIGVSDPSINPLGFVDDVRPYLARAMIGICPVRYGSGTRIKIMTYMAAGLPVVSTSKGAEGVTYINGRDIIITDDPQEFAKAILKLLADAPYRDSIAHNGREFILQNYDWNVIGRSLADTYQNGL